MKRIASLLALSFLLGVAAAPAMAQEDRKIVYKKRTEIDFEDVSVEGELKKPHGAYLLDRRRGNFNPLIKIRTDFNEEIYRSVDEVR